MPYYCCLNQNLPSLYAATLIGVPPPGYESLDGFKGVFISTRVKIIFSLNILYTFLIVCGKLADGFFRRDSRPAG